MTNIHSSFFFTLIIWDREKESHIQSSTTFNIKTRICYQWIKRLLESCHLQYNTQRPFLRIKHLHSVLADLTKDTGYIWSE